MNLTSLERLRERGPRAVKARASSLFTRPRKSGHVLMLHNGRSGSTLLGDMLDQHPDIFWDGETIEKKLHRMEYRSGLGFENLWGAIDLDEGAKEVEKRLRTRAADKIFGSEVQDYHVLMMGTDIRNYIRRMKSLGFTRFVFLDRNYLRKVVSSIVATKRNRFHVGSEAKPKVTTVRIDPERVYIGHRRTTLLGVLRQFSKFRQDALAELRGDQVLTLRYEEDIASDPAAAARKVCDFLGLEPHAPAVHFGKTTDAPLSRIVENYDEFRSVVLNSEFAHELQALEPVSGAT